MFQSRAGSGLTGGGFCNIQGGMSLSLRPSELLSRARTDLRIGVPVVLRDGDRAALVLAAEVARADRLDALRATGRVVLALTDWRARTLKARAYDGDLARIILPEAADIGWVRALADPAGDLASPMKGPFDQDRDGDAALHRAAILLAKSARLLPAALVAPMAGPAPVGLTELALSDLDCLKTLVPVFARVVAARLPISTAPRTCLHIFRPDDGGDEHYAVEVGAPARSGPVLTRLHSACFTGDILGSLKCDCGPQLNTALRQMGAEGAGLLLYLNQEGRGIGLANKMRAYALQDQGFDTVEANHRLGFEDDERDFRVGGAILKELGFSAVRLMTNNPRKVEMLTAQGIDVAQRVPLKVGRTAQNTAYLDTKARKSGHLL